jgi:hypothetical protein
MTNVAQSEAIGDPSIQTLTFYSVRKLSPAPLVSQAIPHWTEICDSALDEWKIANALTEVESEVPGV